MNDRRTKNDQKYEDLMDIVKEKDLSLYKR